MLCFFAAFGNSCKRRFNIAYKTDIDLNVLVDFRKVNVKLNKLCSRCVFCGVARRSVGEANADTDYQISLFISHRRSVMTVHTLHTEKTLVGVGHCRKSHKGTADICVNLVRKSHNFLCHSETCRTAADIDIRLFALIYKLDRLFNITVICDFKRSKVNNAFSFVLAFCNLNILRNVDKHRTGSARFRNLKSLTDSVRKLVYVGNKIVMLCNGQGNTHNIYLLERVLTYKRGGHVACNRNHRY